MFQNFGKHCDFFKDLKHEMKNDGDKLTITLSGKKEKIAIVEKKLKALCTLCCCCGDSCSE